MPFQQTAKTSPRQPTVMSFLFDRIVDIVDERSGIKEAELLAEIIADILDRDDDPLVTGITAQMILDSVQHVIQAGRIVGIDCQTGDSGFTFLVPIGTAVRVVLPVEDKRTRH